MSDGPLVLVVVLVSAICGALLSGQFTQMAVDNWWKDEAVARGAAHYFIGGDGNRQWNWIEPKKPEASK